METILADVCVLATAALALTLLPGLRGSECSILSTREKGAASFLRNGLLLLHAPAEGTGPHRLAQMGIALALQGLGTALILAIIREARDRHEQTRAAASGEARVLQASHESSFPFQCVEFTRSAKRTWKRHNRNHSNAIVEQRLD